MRNRNCPARQVCACGRVALAGYRRFEDHPATVLPLRRVNSLVFKIPESKACSLSPPARRPLIGGRRIHGSNHESSTQLSVVHGQHRTAPAA
jgi:hypothetical protein